ncbi:MAG TPA: galactose-1-phosphate uridylyltransferase, partial [Patescibacteria group bacterium]|nr:galactose-1-phosphate uridylyltransferase [Patescibacteria group bacterium]
DRINKVNSRQWQVLSIKNIYPAVTLDNKKAYGTQEVIIDTPDHTKELAHLSQKNIEKLLEMYAQRTRKLAQNKKLNYILCFKNQGAKAGASITHSHSQVFATSITPDDLTEEARLKQEYQIENQSCPYCDIIKQEMQRDRKIYEDNYIAAFAPYASQYHYEAWIFPRRHLDNITQLNKKENKSLARILKKILEKLDSIDASYNFFLHNVISDPNQHFYIKIQPRESVWAGVELGSGLVINSIPPEEAAKFYRS